MPLHFELVTPEKLVRAEDVHMVVVPGTEGDFGVMEGHAPVMSVIRPGTEGDFGVLEGHAPLMSVIRPGEIAIYSGPNSVTARIHVEGGFAEVNERGLTVLAEAVGEQA